MRVILTARSRRKERGQALTLFALVLPLLLLFSGLALDLGFAYIVKASLSKAVDSAVLAGIKNLSVGKPQAEAIARSTFAANYALSGRDKSSPSVDVVWATDASNNTTLSVNAKTTINTFFIKLLPSFKTLDVNAAATATRAKLIMSLVLDRSGSMTGNGGSSALPPAVTTFINLFDNTNDRVALVTFSSNDTVDVTMRTNFQTPITNAVKTMPFGGGTFSPGGMADGQGQTNSVVLANGENVVRVAVFFTDGLANTVQDTFNCGGKNTLWNYGGFDSGSTVGFTDPVSGSQKCSTSGGTPSCCSGVNQFKSQIDGLNKSFVRQNVTNESEYRTIQIANAMRANNTVVYAIGLGNGINKDFLQQVANDPASPFYDSSKPTGEAVFAPSSQDLNEVFQVIASKILLRLTK